MPGLTTTDLAGHRLNSWKEIAAYFGKDERTVKRWETMRGMPVRRVPGGTRTSVFAYSEELDAWLKAPQQATATEPLPQPVPLAAPDTAAQSRWRTMSALAVVAFVGIAGLGYVVGRYAPAEAVAVQAVPAEVLRLHNEGVVAWTIRTADGFRTAIDKFEAAIAIMPDYAPAHAGLANVFNLISQYTDAAPSESYARAKVSAETAIALDPKSAEAYAALAFNAFYGSHEFTRAFELFEESLALAPDTPQTLHWYALTSMQTGEFERPRRLIDRALALNPEARSIRANAALIHYYSGDTDGAITMLEQLRQARPDYLAVPAYLATIYLDQKNYEAFLDNYEMAARVEGRIGRLEVATAARAALSHGPEAMLRAMLAEQQRLFESGDEAAYKVAATAALLGQADLALDYLAVAVDRSETLGLLVEPEFRSLRGDPRFKALVAKLGLPAS